LAGIWTSRAFARAGWNEYCLCAIREIWTRAVTSKSRQTDALIAFAVDLLAQAEAHHRVANRLEVATRVLARDADSRDTLDSAQVQQVRAHATQLEDLSAANRNLLSEFSRELDALLARARGA
jgi:hypothetical protein